MLLNHGMSATAADDPARTLGRHCPEHCLDLLCVAVVAGNVTTFLSSSLLSNRYVLCNEALVL